MRKLISFLMALIAAALAANASVPVLASPSRAFSYDMSACDVNGDGMVNILDLNAVLNALLGYDSSGNCDVNNDGVVNYIDYAWLFACIMQDDSLTATEDQCDFNGDGKVDGQDWDIIFEAWKNHANEERFDLYHYYDEDYEEEVGVGFDYLDLGPIAMLLAELAENEAPVVLAFSESEIWLSPGESMEVHIVLQSMDEIVSAGQIGFNVYDPTRIRDNGVVLDDCYGDKHYFLPEYSSENSSANSGCTETGVYRIAFYDLMGTYGTGYWPLESFTGPVNVFAFTVHATESWNDQYVTIELDKDWSYVISPSNDHNYFTEPMVLTVKNKAADWPVTATPDITTEMTDDAVIVTATGDGEVKLYQDGIEVENPCVVPRTYVNQTILFGATAREEGKLMSDMKRENVAIPAHSYYIVGNAPFGDWDPTAGVMMTPNGDGTYSYVAEIDGSVWFVFASGLAADWETFNANYRYGPSDYDLVVGLDQWVATPRGGNMAYKFTGNAAVYTITFDPANLCFRIVFNDWSMRTDTPVITAETTEEAVIVTATGNGEVKLYKGGVELENPYYVPRTDVDQTITFRATAREEGKLISETATLVVTVPAMDLPTSDAPVITAETTADAVTVTAIGNGEVKLYLDGVEVDNPCVIPRTAFDLTFIFTATCKEEGKLISEIVTLVVTVPALPKTDAPVITAETTADAVIVTAVGNGVVRLFVEGVEVVNPYTIRRMDKEFTVDISATAQEEGKLISDYVTMTVIVPAKEVEPVVVYTPENVTVIPAMTTADVSWQDDYNNTWNLRYRPYGSESQLWDFPYPGYEEQVAGFTIFDADGDGYNWGIVYSNDSQDDLCFVSVSYQGGVALAPDNWLLTPEVLLGGTLKFKTWNISSSYPDMMAVYVCPNSDWESLAEFILLQDNIVPGASPEQHEINLGGYSGRGVIAFRHYNSYDQYRICLDDIEVTSSEWVYVNGLTQANYTIDGLTQGVTYEVQVQGVNDNGISSDWTESVEFTTSELRGDVNYTGNVDITDLQAMVNYIFGEYNRPFNFTAADLNNDHVVNVQDVVGEANLLLSMDLLAQAPGASLRAPRQPGECAASLWWKDDVLYLRTSVPVAAIDIMNQVDGDIQWTVGQYGLVVKSTTDGGYHHAVIYSLGDGLIEPGVLPIATTTGRSAMVAAAMLSDDNAELVDVELNNQITGINRVETDDDVTCHMDGSVLAITSGTMLNDVDVTIYSIDGKIISNKKLGRLESGTTVIDMSGIVGSNRYLIVVVRNGRQILSTQKLTQNK